MLLLEAYARERSIGAYQKVASLIRKMIGQFSPKQMASVFDIKEKNCTAIIKCIKDHPDWDNERVAEEIDWDE